MNKKENSEYIVSKAGAKLLHRGTESYQEFKEEGVGLELMLWFIFNAQFNKEEAKKSLTNVVIKEGGENIISEQFINFLASNNSDRIFDKESHEPYFSNIAFCRIMDNALCFFKDILSEVIKKDPRPLNLSKEKETHEFILSFNSIEELKESLIDKKIEQLFYGSIKVIKKFFIDRLGIELFENEKEEEWFSVLIKQRNLIVHNRGVITSDLVDILPLSEKENGERRIGEKMFFKYEHLSDINKLVNNIMVEIDIKLKNKFKLKTIEIN